MYANFHFCNVRTYALYISTQTIRAPGMGSGVYHHVWHANVPHERFELTEGPKIANWVVYSWHFDKVLNPTRQGQEKSDIQDMKVETNQVNLEVLFEKFRNDNPGSKYLSLYGRDVYSFSFL